MPIPDPKRMAVVMERIARAELELKKALEEYYSLFNTTIEQKNTPTKRRRNGSLGELIIDVLASNSNKSFRIPEVAAVLNEEDNNKVGRILFKLYKDQVIESRGHGLYGARLTNTPVNET